jgi:sucrose-6-phosphate hydrolase SacC (GH32 family)
MNHPPLLNRFLLIAFVSLTTTFSTHAAAPSYREPWRPQFHFTPATNWMNDPNGMVFYDGEYHLFYQYNPWGIKWGHMSWGHAVSKDLVRWEHLPVALYEENDVMIFSGSAVVDWKNSSGFGKDGMPPMVAIYTGHYTKKPLQNQHIAYSNDRGRTWTKYAGNPVLDIGAQDFRDPKVLWHEPTKRWVMTIAWPVERKVRFYSSPNLKDWTHLSDFGPAGSTTGIWECPDLFPLRVEGKRGAEKWALIVNVGSGAPAGGSGCQYFVGDFDGRQFTLDASYPKPQPEFVPPGKVLADFEGNDYRDWRTTGTAFGDAPARGKFSDQQDVDGFRGRRLVNTFFGGDRSEGTLTSPEFELTHNHLSFLIGGGNHAGKTCLNLLVEGRIVRTATGAAAERLAWKSWDVRELRGKKATLEIVDAHPGGWGHINVDHILLADAPARPATQPALWADFGPDFYAAVSWSDIPKRDGRRLWIGWMSNWQYANDVPTTPWRSAMSIPRELNLRETPDGLRLVQQPVRELSKLRDKRYRLRNATLAEANEWLGKLKLDSPLLELAVEFDPATSAEGATLRFTTGAKESTAVRWKQNGELVLDRTQSGRADFHPRFATTHSAPLRPAVGNTLRAFLDTSSLELIAGGGETSLTALILPAAGVPRLQFEAGTATTRLRRVEIWELRSAVR